MAVVERMRWSSSSPTAVSPTPFMTPRGGIGVLGVVDADAARPGFLPDPDPERVETRCSEVFGKDPRFAVPPGRHRLDRHRFRTEPQGARAGLRIFEAGACAVLIQCADFAPFGTEHFGEPGTGQGQQTDRRNLPRTVGGVPVQHRAEAFEFVAAEKARDGLSRVLCNVGAGVGDILAELAPLARGGKHGAQISKARLVAPCRSALAASNQAETREWSTASSRTLPNAGFSRLRM